MTTSIFAVAPINGSDAAFRAWGGALSNALAAVGFVKTTDTGQVNWSTVTFPSAISTYQGYEVWRFADGLQGTYPLFFKLEYGSGTSAATSIGMRFTLGKGSDGAGNITGVLNAATVLSASASTATASNWYLSSGDGSMLAFAPAVGLFVGTSSNWLNWVVDRSRAADGLATGVGLYTAWQVGAATVQVRVVNYATTASVSPVQWPMMVPSVSNATSIGGGGKTPLFPAVLTDSLGNFWQPRSVLVGLSGDIGQFSPITVSGFGTYMGMGPGMGTYDNAHINAQAAVLWQ